MTALLSKLLAPKLVPWTCPRCELEFQSAADVVHCPSCRELVWPDVLPCGC